MNKISPKKLLNSKWTAVNPKNKEKHFLVTAVDFNDEGEIIHCEIEAVISSRAEPLDWEVLKEPERWRQGWK